VHETNFRDTSKQSVIFIAANPQRNGKVPFFGIACDVQFQMITRLFAELPPAENVLGFGKLSVVPGHTLFSR